MTEQVLKARIALRRNTSAELQSVADSFIPRRGEVIIIDTENDGTRAKVGDGINAISKLPFTDETVRSMVSGIIVSGYYFEKKFYQDIEHKVSIVGYEYKMYIDINTSIVYTYNKDEDTFITVSYPAASNTVAGIAKLYSGFGNNSDGSINQKAVTNEINKKFTISLDPHDNEGLIFEDGIPDNEV